MGWCLQQIGARSRANKGGVSVQQGRGLEQIGTWIPMLVHSVPISVRNPLRIGVRKPIRSSIACTMCDLSTGHRVGLA
eukprot:234677-Rhodomonas_salina.2